MRDDDWAPLITFDTDDPEFVRGVEFGCLYEMAKQPGEVVQIIHGENAEMAIRLAELMGRPFSGEPLDDEGYWTEVTLGEPDEPWEERLQSFGETSE